MCSFPFPSNLGLAATGVPGAESMFHSGRSRNMSVALPSVGYVCIPFCDSGVGRLGLSIVWYRNRFNLLIPPRNVFLMINHYNNKNVPILVSGNHLANPL